MSDNVIEMEEKDKTRKNEEAGSNVGQENIILVKKSDIEVNIDAIDNNNKTEDEIGQCVASNVDGLNQKDGKEINNREYSVYGYCRSKPASHVTIVQFTDISGKRIPPTDGEPLNYDPSTRNTFVKLVFSIVLIMLLLTAGFNALVYTNDDLSHVFRKYNLIFLMVASIMLISLSYAVACSECTRAVPCNFIVLIIAVIAMSLLSACITVRYRTEIIFYAFIATAAVVMICLALACTSFDFTKYLIFVVVIMGVIAVISMIVLIVRLATGAYMKPLQMFILFVAALVHSVMLVIELQMILGGKTVELSEKDYAMGAFMLYTSIMDMFIKLLLLIAGIDGE